MVRIARKYTGTYSRVSRYGKRLGKIRAHQRCNGCGRLLPKSSWMCIWQVWSEGRRERLRFCSDCQDVIYGCDERKPMHYQDGGNIIRDICRSCDSFPFCERVEYLKGSEPDDWYFGDLDYGEHHH